MDIVFHEVHGHSTQKRVIYYDVGVGISIPTEKSGERPYRCYVRLYSTYKDLIDWLKVIPRAECKAFAVRFLTKDHLGEVPLIQIVQGVLEFEMDCPWRGGQRGGFLATIAVPERFEVPIPHEVVIQIEPDAATRT